MEEQKSKEVKMEAVNTQEPSSGSQKLTYEQLNEACVQLSQQNKFLAQQLEQAEKVIYTFNRLDYLFKVVEISSKSSSWQFDSEFVADCIAKIQKIMTPPAEESSEEKKES